MPKTKKSKNIPDKEVSEKKPYDKLNHKASKKTKDEPKSSKAADNKKHSVNILVPDTSVLIEGLVSAYVLREKIIPQAIFVHEAILSELEYQANENKETGYLGLLEIKRLRELCEKKNIELEMTGKKPSQYDLERSSQGAVDSLIRDLAYDEGAILFTGNKVQREVSKAKGIEVIFVEIEQLRKKLRIESYFDENTMSVHLRENVVPYAKKGRPGEWDFIKIGGALLSRDDIQEISREIIEEANIRRDGFIEIERPGSTIVQLANYRIVITKPSFSDGWEITAVRPVKKLALEDYALDEKLRSRLVSHAEGILIAGAPGHGKSTFAQALAEHYSSEDKVVKTVEAPRDLILPENITQYSMSQGDPQEIHDVLLLTRPDYTIFDEMRNTDDFKLFADLRLSGVGMVGIVHATNPVDAVQRFVGRIELGVIPQVIDTVIFIKDGEPKKVLSLSIIVKVPAGMTEADLARPVVVVNDFLTGKAEYEMYTYGEQTVVVSVDSQLTQKKAVHQMAEQQIEQFFRKFTDNAKVEMQNDNRATVFVNEQDISSVIGKQGKNIQSIEDHLGLRIDVKSLNEHQMGRSDNLKGDFGDSGNMKRSGKVEISFRHKSGKSHIQIILNHHYAKKEVDIFLGNDYLLSAKVSKNSVLKISKKNKLGKLLSDALQRGENVRVLC